MEIFKMPLDPETIKALITAGTGSAVGTVLKSIIKPETNLKRWLLQSTSAVIVGALFGLAMTEYAQFGQFTSLAAASVGALLSEQIIGFFLARGESLNRGKIDLSIKEKP
jgi:uncharacterized membrane protein YeaQ/YmgE (transglycosylase-associated protein family)